MSSEGEVVICAAIQYGDKLFRGHRHADAIAAAHNALSWTFTRREINNLPHKQGFITSTGRFVDRVEACQIQKAAGIESVLPPDQAFFNGELYSEDLY